MIFETLSMIGRGLIWQSALLAAIVFFVLYLLPREQISARYRVALSGLFGAGFLLALPFLPAVSFGLDLAPEIFQATNTPATITPPIMEATANNPSPAIVMSENRAAFPFGLMLVFIWLIGSFVGLSRLALAAWQGRKLARRFTPVPFASSTLSRPVTIMRSSDISAPLVFGLLNPVIVVPENFALGLNNLETRVILEHEIAHIARGDLWVNLAQRIVLALLWWCVPLYWIHRQIGAERENICDAIATNQMCNDNANPARLLANALVRFAEQRTNGATPALAIGIHPGIHPHAKLLARRIQRLCDTNPVPQLSKKLLLGTSLAIPVTLMMLSLVTPRAIAHPPNKYGGSDIQETTNHTDRTDVISSQWALYTDRAAIKPLQWALYMAVRNGDQTTVNTLIKTNGISPDFTIPGDGSPLIAAVRNHDKAMLDMLIAAGADVNLPSYGDGSPLITAAQLGDNALIKFLIKSGARVNMSVGGDGNPLIAAALSGRTQTAKTLLDHGANVNAQVQGDETPLINAAQQGHLDMAKFLVQNGADVNLGMWADGPNGRAWRTPFGEAQKHDHTKVMKFLRAQGARIIKTPKPAQHSEIVTGRITSHYGLSRAGFGGKVHTGIDIANTSGTPIYAPANAKVIQATDLYDNNPKWGKVVIIETDGGVQTLFAHLKDYSVIAGQSVRAGTQVARLGNTGKSTGPHVHIATLIDGHHVDPLTVWSGLKSLKK